METPEGRANRLIEEIVAEAVGPISDFRSQIVKSKIWHLIEEEKREAIAAEEIEEEK